MRFAMRYLIDRGIRGSLALRGASREVPGLGLVFENPAPDGTWLVRAATLLPPGGGAPQPLPLSPSLALVPNDDPSPVKRYYNANQNHQLGCEYFNIARSLETVTKPAVCPFYPGIPGVLSGPLSAAV